MIGVFGAGGFVGSRLVRALVAEGRPAKAAVRSWASVARVAGSGIGWHWCDASIRADVARVTEGLDVVVNAVNGDRNSLVESTAVLAEAARLQGARYIHLSSVAVYGAQEGTICEDAPLQTGISPYGDWKVEAEGRLASEVDRGLVAFILRPAIIYGPESDLWVGRYFQRASRGVMEKQVALGSGRCNLVHVDDVVRAILICLDAPVATAATYNVSGSGELTWAEYWGLLLAANRNAFVTGKRARHWKSRALEPVRKIARVALRHFREPIMRAYKGNRVSRVVMRAVEGQLRETPTLEEVRLYQADTRFSCNRAAELLGFRPRVSEDEGIAQSREWAEWVGY